MATPARERASRARGSRTLAFAALVAGAALAVMKCGCAAHRGPVSGHFDGTRFVNPEGRYSLLDTARWLAEMETVDWPEWIDDPPQAPPPRSVGRGALRVTYVNHATVLVQVDGVNVLTDPVWSDRAGPTSWLGAKRVRAPGVRFELLPPIDYVLLSHDHYDHLDLATIEKLDRRDHPKFVAGLGVRALLESRGIRDVVELDWWQTYEREGAGIRIAFVPARHGSGRWPLLRDRTLWGGFVIEAPSGQVYFAGDTALGAFVGDIARAFQRIRLAILPIGSYEKRWFMRTQHTNPDDPGELIDQLVTLVLDVRRLAVPGGARLYADIEVRDLADDVVHVRDRPAHAGGHVGAGLVEPAVDVLKAPGKAGACLGHHGACRLARGIVGQVPEGGEELVDAIGEPGPGGLAENSLDLAEQILRGIESAEVAILPPVAGVEILIPYPFDAAGGHPAPDLPDRGLQWRRGLQDQALPAVPLGARIGDVMTGDVDRLLLREQGRPRDAE